MRFAFIAKHRGIWPVSWICEALGVSRSGFHAWLVRTPSVRSRSDEELGARVRASFISSYRTYGARRVWHDLLPEGLSCGLHRVERLMRAQGLKARPRRRGYRPCWRGSSPDELRSQVTKLRSHFTEYTNYGDSRVSTTLALF